MPVLMKIAKHQSEDGRKHGQDNGDDDGRLLVAHRHHGIAADLRQHVLADVLDLLVELVAQRVGPGQAGPGFREIAGLEQRQQPLVFFAEIAAEIAGDVLDPIVDPAEPGIVGAVEVSSMIALISARAACASWSISCPFAS